MSKSHLDGIVQEQKLGEVRGLFSICSAHPSVLEAAMRFAPPDSPVLIEATCNQVNQYGGYTGMQPADFYRLVHDLADKIGLPHERILLGGDHLGPLVWSGESERAAMDKAKVLVRDYVRAGFTKIHLDPSMPCADDPALTVETIARRAAELAVAAESVGGGNLRYVVGTEVPPAGGAQAGHGQPAITSPEAAGETLETLERAFRASGAPSAWERVVALVVQPGVDFGDQFIHPYQREQAAGLKGYIESVPGIVYEAHSTDYQSRTALHQMVEDHFAILKVGPALTFAFREAVFALAMMEAELGFEDPSRVREALETAMLANPVFWREHYRGSETELKIARQFSFSDRIRYYWTDPGVSLAVDALIRNLGARPLPLSLISQYMPEVYLNLRDGLITTRPAELLLCRIRDVLADYQAAVNP